MMVGEDADFADDADRLIFIASGGVYGGKVAPGTEPKPFQDLKWERRCMGFRLSQ